MYGVVRMCPGCGRVVPKRRNVRPRFCPECGANLDVPPPPPPSPRVQPYDAPPQPRRTAAGAVAALVLGIVSFCIPIMGLIFGVSAIVFGVRARDTVKNSHGQLNGGGLATAGVVLGTISTAIWLLVCLGVG